MKRCIVFLAALMLLSSSFAFAKDDVKVEAGIKIWNNSWESKDPDPVAGGTTKFDASILIGPAISVTLPSNVFFEASYLMSATDYKNTEGPAQIEVERNDLDIAVGYQFIPEIGIYVGYRKSSLDWKFNDGAGFSDSGSIDLSGPVIGLRGNYSFNDVFGVYASVAYLMTEYDEQGFTEDDPGTQFELGVKAKFSKEFSGTLGYKVESFEGDKSKVKDTFSGLTLGVMYAF
jgi:predicted porin